MEMQLLLLRVLLGPPLLFLLASGIGGGSLTRKGQDPAVCLCTGPPSHTKVVAVWPLAGYVHIHGTMK